MKEISNYFKGEKEFYEFVLIYLDGRQRNEMLGVTIKHYGNHKLADEWFLNISNKITDEIALRKLTRIYNEML